MAFKDAVTGWAVTGCGSIMKTTDGGQSWLLTGDPDSICADLYDIVVNTAGNLIVSGDHGRIMRSEDDGANWSAWSFPDAGRRRDQLVIVFAAFQFL